MAPFLRSQARSAAYGPSVAALRPASGERIQALQTVFEEAVSARKTSSRSKSTAQQHTQTGSAQAGEVDMMNLNSTPKSSFNAANMAGEHTLDQPMEIYGQILVDMSKAHEDNFEADSAGHDLKMSDADDAVLAEEPVRHEPTNWLDIPNELKDIVIEQYILAVISDKSTRLKTKRCGQYDFDYLHLYPGQFATWAKQENYKLGLLRASMDIKNAASRIINGLVAQKHDVFMKIARPMSCGSPTCCHYWTDAAFEKAQLLSLQAFCRGKTAWKAWAKNTE